mgnify:FL=1
MPESLFNVPLTELTLEQDYKKGHLAFFIMAFLLSVHDSCPIVCSRLFFWYNGDMIQLIFTLSSHMIFIFLSFHLLSTVVNWEKLLKVNADNAFRIRFLILLLSIALGFLLSSFFLSLYALGRDVFSSNL